MAHLRQGGVPRRPGREAAPRPQGRGWCRALRLSQSEGGKYAGDGAGGANRGSVRAASTGSRSVSGATLHHARPSRTGASPRPAPSVSRSLRTIEAVRPAPQIPNVGSVPPVPNLGPDVIGTP